MLVPDGLIEILPYCVGREACFPAFTVNKSHVSFSLLSHGITMALKGPDISLRDSTHVTCSGNL